MSENHINYKIQQKDIEHIKEKLNFISISINELKTNFVQILQFDYRTKEVNSRFSILDKDIEELKKSKKGLISGTLQIFINMIIAIVTSYLVLNLVK